MDNKMQQVNDPDLHRYICKENAFYFNVKGLPIRVSLF